MGRLMREKSGEELRGLKMRGQLLKIAEYAGKRRTIWSLTVFPSRSIVRILKSTPMVEM